MELDAWLRKHEMADAAFAARVACNQTTVNRTRRGVTMPEPALIARIEAATGGEVQASDLFATFMAARAGSDAQSQASAA